MHSEGRLPTAMGSLPSCRQLRLASRSVETVVQKASLLGQAGFRARLFEPDPPLAVLRAALVVLRAAPVVLRAALPLSDAARFAALVDAVAA